MLQNGKYANLAPFRVQSEARCYSAAETFHPAAACCKLQLLFSEQKVTVAMFFFTVMQQPLRVSQSAHAVAEHITKISSIEQYDAVPHTRCRTARKNERRTITEPAVYASDSSLTIKMNTDRSIDRAKSMAD
jgi:hypothetical protein